VNQTVARTEHAVLYVLRRLTSQWLIILTITQAKRLVQGAEVIAVTQHKLTVALIVDASSESMPLPVNRPQWDFGCVAGLIATVMLA
jgi:hypothetical protein